jgi:eukaryotic-like serine/threonine-protein kinase
MSRLRADFLDRDQAITTALFEQLLDDAERKPQSRFQIGQRFGSFVLKQAIGQGGMSEVFLAERIEGGFAQQVALKLISQQDFHGGKAQLFSLERANLASLEHPGIARVIDGGSLSDGTLWLAMEYINGESLDVYLQNRPSIKLREKLRLLIELCDAVQYAHSKLLVHRDIKRSNIMVRENGRVVLLDFGIAADLRGNRPDQAIAAMTPAIAAPEQWRKERASTAIDIYQLGLILQGMDAALPADLQAVCARATAPDATRRYATVEALQADLQRFLCFHPVQAAKAKSIRKMQLFCRRNWAVLGASALATLLLMVTSIYFTLNIQRERARAEKEAQSAQTVSAFLTDMLMQASPTSQQGKSLSALELVGVGRKQLRQLEQASDANSASKRELRIRLSLLLGKLYNQFEDYQSAKPLLESALALQQGLVSRPADAHAQHMLAQNEYLLAVAISGGNSGAEQAQVLLDSALERYRKLPSNNPEVTTSYRAALRAAAWLAFSRGKAESAIAQTREALQLLRQSNDTETVEELQLMLNLGQMLGTRGASVEALSLLKSACEKASSSLGDAHPTSINACGGYALGLVEQRQFVQADLALEKLLVSSKKAFGATGVQVMHVQNAQAYSKLQQGDLLGAEDLARLALSGYLALPPENDSNSVGSMQMLAEIHLVKSQPQQALTMIQRMWEKSAQGGHAMDPDHGQRSALSARVYLANGQCEKARSYAELAQKLATATKSSQTLAAIQRLATELTTCRQSEPKH